VHVDIRCPREAQGRHLPPPTLKKSGTGGGSASPVPEKHPEGPCGVRSPAGALAFGYGEGIPIVPGPCRDSMLPQQGETVKSRAGAEKDDEPSSGRIHQPTFPPVRPLTCVDESFRYRAHKPDAPVLTRPNLPPARIPGPIAAPMSTRLLLHPHL
jgi:hypothetical protein